MKEALNGGGRQPLPVDVQIEWTCYQRANLRARRDYYGRTRLRR